jgi:hypothetical protein
MDEGQKECEGIEDSHRNIGTKKGSHSSKKDPIFREFFWREIDNENVRKNQGLFIGPKDKVQSEKVLVFVGWELGCADTIRKQLFVLAGCRQCVRESG